MGSTADCYVDTCLLVSLFLQDEGYPTAERWLAGSVGDALWISHWVLLEFAGAVGLRLRRGELKPSRAEAIHRELEEFRRDRLALASRAALPLVSADQRLVQVAGQLGIPARLVI